jgi:SAM-dependent methyltransferase
MADWNERYKQGEHVASEHHPLVVQFASQLKPGRALDLACGAGRHAIWLARHGWSVTAVDYSRAALELLQQRAAEYDAAIDFRLADLERHEFVIEPQSYDLIVLCHYLQRDLFPLLKEGVRIGGTVIARIALIDDDPNVKPMNPAYLLNPRELRAVFEGWELRWYFEGKSGEQHSRAAAEIVARRRV